MLRLTIQMGWAYLGAVSLYAAFCCLIHVLLHGWKSIGTGWAWQVSSFCVVLLSFGVLATLVYSAWVVVFRFSEIILMPSVFLASLPMAVVAEYGNHHYFVPLFQAAIHSSSLSLMAFLPLTLFIVVLAGWFKFVNLMPLVLSRMLFPERFSPRVVA